MALSDSDIQGIHSKVTNVLKPTKANQKILSGDNPLIINGKQYSVVNHVPKNLNSDDVTQAVAVAPMDANGNVDYSQTAIVVAGTQPDNPASLWNAVRAGWDPTTSLTAQTQDVRNFYQSTLAKLKNKSNGYISNMSGFSQSGPAVAKVASEQRVPHITNFDDWASRGATTPYLMGLFKNLPHEYLTPSDIKYLNTHARIYLDGYRALTSLDGGGGNVPYGKQFIIQSSDIDVNDYIWTDKNGVHFNFAPWLKDHTPSFAKLKGNGLDIDWYIRNNKFCSGMTYDQALKIAKYKARKAKSLSLDPTTWVDSTDYKKYLEDYVRTYGPFAPDNPAEQLLKGFNKDIKSYKGQLKSASGGKAISLRSDLVKTVAGKASLQAEEYARNVKETLESEKRRLESDIQEVRHQAYQIARHLQTWEIESLLSQFSMSTCWDAGVESTTLEEVEKYQKELTTFSEKLSAAADKIVAVDRESAQLFN